MLTVGSLFSGIGGLDLGLERAGMAVRWQCEADPYCRAVLAKHWPDVPCYPDVRELTATLEPVDVLAGGFPCQPVSVAGRRRGAADERWLWPEFARLIRLLRPRYALMENVPGLLAGGGMAEVLGDLADLGFDAEWACVPAAAVGAPHLRYRIFIVAHPVSRQLRNEPGRLRRKERVRLVAGGQAAAQPGDDGPTRPLADPEGFGGQLRAPARERPGRPPGSRFGMADPDSKPLVWAPVTRHERHPWATEPDVGRVAHGVPSRVERLRALGNAVVPQVAEWVGRQIVAHAEKPHE